MKSLLQLGARLARESLLALRGRPFFTVRMAGAWQGAASCRKMFL